MPPQGTIQPPGSPLPTCPVSGKTLNPKAQCSEKKKKKGTSTIHRSLTSVIFFPLPLDQDMGKHERTNLVSGPNPSSPFSARRMTQAPDDMPWPPPCCCWNQKIHQPNTIFLPSGSDDGEETGIRGDFSTAMAHGAQKRAGGWRTGDLLIPGRTGLPKKGHPQSGLEARAYPPSNHTPRLSGLPFLQGVL